MDNLNQSENQEQNESPVERNLAALKMGLDALEKQADNLDKNDAEELQDIAQQIAKLVESVIDKKQVTLLENNSEPQQDADLPETNGEEQAKSQESEAEDQESKEKPKPENVTELIVQKMDYFDGYLERAEGSNLGNSLEQMKRDGSTIEEIAKAFLTMQNSGGAELGKDYWWGSLVNTKKEKIPDAVMNQIKTAYANELNEPVSNETGMHDKTDDIVFPDGSKVRIGGKTEVDDEGNFEYNYIYGSIPIDKAIKVVGDKLENYFSERNIVAETEEPDSA